MRGNWPVIAAAKVNLNANLITLSSPMAFVPFELSFIERFTFRRVSGLPMLVGYDPSIAVYNQLRVCFMPLNDLADGKPGPRSGASWTQLLGIELAGDICKGHVCLGAFKNQSKCLKLLGMGHQAAALVLETVGRVPPYLTRAPLFLGLVALFHRS